MLSRLRNLGLFAFIFGISFQWIYFKNTGTALAPPWDAIASGAGIFAAAFILSWGAELAQLEIPQSLAIAFLALVAVLPEYAVDMYFAWRAGKDPQYIHFATANMTGSNRLLIGVGWAMVVGAYFLRTRKKEVQLEKESRAEILALLLSTLYCFILPLKGTLTWVDSIFLLFIFGGYLSRAIRSKHEPIELEGPIAPLAGWPRGLRILITLLFFFYSGYTIFIAAKPFAEGLLHVGRRWGIEEFLLVQWLAPLASEAPEFIVAIIFALHARATSSLGTLISSKVNQWTLLVGMLPLAYHLSGGHWGPMVMDSRQCEEIFLTAAQSVFAIVIILNLRFSIWEALVLFVLFGSQIFFTSTEARNLYAVLYLSLALAWLIWLKDYRRNLFLLFKEGFGRGK
jgi:cation:H+ antiporter